MNSRFDHISLSPINERILLLSLRDWRSKNAMLAIVSLTNEDVFDFWQTLVSRGMISEQVLCHVGHAMSSSMSCEVDEEHLQYASKITSEVQATSLQSGIHACHSCHLEQRS
jgi:hypothetical protein